MIKKNKCQRCGKESITLICSMFNTRMICIECKNKETKRPDYKKAENADIKAIKSGNYNFQGIGY